jgi:nitroreductase
MDTLEAIKTRRSVKSYDPSYRMPDGDFKKLMSLAILSPTSYNIQHWRFVNIADAELRRKVREAAADQAQVTDASILFAICADTKAWEKNPARYWKNAPEQTRELLVSMIDTFYRGREQIQRDEAIRSCGIVAQTMMLAAKAMGYDSSPMIGFDADAVARLINLPADHVIGLLLAIGKGTKEAHQRGGQLPLDDVLFTDGF